MRGALGGSIGVLIARQGEEKCRAIANLTLDRYFAAVRLHNRFDQIKAETGAMSSARQIVIDAIEPLKNLVDLIFGDADAFIAHEDGNALFGEAPAQL